MEGSKNPETCVLYAGGRECQFVNRVKVSLRSQRQPPGPDSILGIVIPWGAKSDILRWLVVRKDLFYPVVKLLGKCRQVLGGVKLGTPQPP